jgi:preprotein translocase subunit SecG
MTFVQILLMLLLSLTAIFLILLIMIQRGKGGGLAGAFGGMGGQSAFGTKAGDLFTRITIGAAAFWIILCVVTVKVLSSGQGKLDVGESTATSTDTGAGGEKGTKAPAGASLPAEKPGNSQPAGAPAPAPSKDAGK